MKDVFVLPEKWCIRSNGQQMHEEIIEPYLVEKEYACPEWDGDDYYYHFCDSGIFAVKNKHKTYTKITTDQFKQYVLGEKQQQKEIVGWKLKEEYMGCKEAALKLCGTIANWENSLMTYDISISQIGYMSKLKQAGVLDLWFTPVYKQDEPEYKVGDFVVVKNYVQCGEGNGVVTTNLVSELFEVKKNGATGMHYKESAFSVKERGNYYNIKEWHIVRKATPEEIKSAQTPQITINGYKGEFFDWGISFNSGCAKIQKEIFISLSKHIGQKFEYTNREVESITIGKGTFTKEQIKEIAEFYLNK